MIYTSYRLTDNISRVTLLEWIKNNGIQENVVYNWVSRVITFENEEDAIAFSLTFGIEREITTLERMIRNEESSN